MPLARELGLIPENQVAGIKNTITDVPGVMVGHQTIRRDNLHTGVTAILPHGGNLFLEKVPAAVHVINGFGKSSGLVQIEELGSIETPILLTNTFGVGTCGNALIRQAIKANPSIGRSTSTVNPVVCECNDGKLNDIQAMAVSERDALAAIENACDLVVTQGSVGAGTGMTCFGFKGGIGTSSRRVSFDDREFHFGVLVLSNFGATSDLVLPDGFKLKSPEKSNEKDDGSIIIVVATDVPMDHRQLKRVIKRCGAGLAGLGSYWGHGSGDIVLGFSTASRIQHRETRHLIPGSMINENKIDSLFHAAAQCTREAILNSMTMSKATTGRDGFSVPSLAESLEIR